eukprot:Opistho-2@17762
MAPPVNNKSYFASPHPLLLIGVIGGLTALEIVAFQPHLFPYDYLGPIGAGIRYLADNHASALQIGFACAIAAHVAEGLYAYVIAKGAGMSTAAQWGFQTFLFGFPSTILIRKHVRRMQLDTKAKSK